MNLHCNEGENKEKKTRYEWCHITKISRRFFESRLLLSSQYAQHHMLLTIIDKSQEKCNYIMKNVHEYWNKSSVQCVHCACLCYNPSIQKIRLTMLSASDRWMNGCTYVFIIDVPFCTNIHSHKKALHSRFSETVKMEKEHVIRLSLALSSSNCLDFSKNHHLKFIKKNTISIALEWHLKYHSH